jgi:flagellar biogenesis protein FliO
MDHPRPCGPAAFAIFVIATLAVPAVSATTPPASGVGDATLTPRVNEVVSEPSTNDEPPLDPTELAERIASRIAAVDAADAGSAEAAGPPASVIETTPSTDRTLEPSMAADPVAVLPAPRPSGDRFIDRFDRADTDSVASATGPVVEGWWMLPEVRVGILLAAFVAVAVVARRWSNARGPRGGRPSGVLSVLARYPFGRGASLVLLEVGPRMVLVHQQGGRGGEVRSIAEFTTPEEIAELRTRLGIARRESESGFGRDLERHLGLYDRKGRPQGFGGSDGLPLDDAMETVDLTRRRPRRGSRTN